jgi:hypothetical protein
VKLRFLQINLRLGWDRSKSSHGPPLGHRWSRECEILNISHPYRPARPDKGIALVFFCLLYFLLLKYYSVIPSTLRDGMYDLELVKSEFLGEFSVCTLGKLVASPSPSKQILKAPIDTCKIRRALSP